MFELSLVFHLLNSVCFELLCKLEQVSDILPIYFSGIIDESLMLFEILFIAIKELVHMVILEDKAELNRQKVISYKGHKQNEIVDNILHSTVFHFF